MLKKIVILIMIIISYNVLQKCIISQKKKYKKCSPGKYILSCVAVSIRWISIRFDSEEEDVNRGNKLIVFNSKGSVHKF